MRRRIVVLLLSSAIASLGLVGFSAAPASASCIEIVGLEEFGCINPCPPGPWYCTE
jgi:hypothetical protein